MPLKTLDKIFEKDINNPALTESYLEEKAKLENALAVLKAREDAGLTQRDLAEKSGVPQSTIARIEKWCILKHISEYKIYITIYVLSINMI